MVSTSARIQEVERIEAPSPEWFDRHHVDRNEPVLLTGVVDEWACSRWTPDFIRSVWGDRRIEVGYHEDGDHGTAHREVFSAAAKTSWRRALAEIDPGAGLRRELRAGEFLDLLLRDPPDRRYILSSYPLEDVSPELLGDVHYDRYFKAPRFAVKMFLGADGYTPLHYHGYDQALVALIKGRKRFALFPPEQIPLLHPYPWYTPLLNMAQVDDRAPNYERFPKFESARPLVVDMEESDLLFIPVHWFHSVQSTGFALGLTCFWPARRRNFVLPTPTVQLCANRFVSPVTVAAKMRRKARWVKYKVLRARVAKLDPTGPSRTK